MQKNQPKKLYAKTFAHSNKSIKNPFTLEIGIKFCLVDTHFALLNHFLGHISTFCNFELERGRNGS
jgi:hypothetical protein